MARRRSSGTKPRCDHYYRAPFELIVVPTDARVRADGCGGCGYQRSMRVLWPGKADTLVELR